MAVLNSNLKRFLLIASLLLSACSGLESTANDILSGSGIQDATAVTDGSDNASIAASETQEDDGGQQATPTLSTGEEQSEESTIPEEASPTAEDPPTATIEPSPTVEPTEEPSPTPEATPTATPIPEPTPLPVSITSNTADMLLVLGGEFEMGADVTQLLEQCILFHDGCDEAWFSSSGPIHLVQLDPYYLDVNEVTNDAFLEFLEELEDVETGCDGQLCFNIDDSQIETDDEGQYFVETSYFEHPVAGASWYGAAAFCEWRGARLPTEAEWEMAASWDSENNQKSLYPWGDEFDGSAVNYCDINCEETQASNDVDDGFALTAPVGSYENGRSAVGAYDMGGNVWEWINDWYSDDYYGQSAETNPPGPEEGDNKVVRGGSWVDTGNFATTAVRFPAPPTESGNSIGFRCAIEAVPADEVLAQAPEAEGTEDAAEEAIEEVAEDTAEETTEETTEEIVEDTAEEAAEEFAAEVAEEATEETAAEESEAAPAPISINCDLNPGVDNGATYTVGACDWLAKIANNLGVTYQALLAANPQITDPNLIFPGQILNIPDRSGTTGGTPPPAAPPGPQGPPGGPPQPPGGLGG